MPGSPERESLCYFKFRPRHDKSTCSSPAVSPSAAVDSPPNPIPPKPLRPLFKSRPQSDHNTIHSRVKVQTIEEDATTENPINASYFASDPRLESTSRRRLPAKPGSAARATPVQTAAGGSQHSTRSEGCRPSSARELSEASPSPPARPRPGHAWSRSKSGSIWYERLKHSPDQSHESSQPSKDMRPVPKRLLTPLRPPLAPVHGSIDNHQVKVETSFTKLRPDKIPAADQLASLAAFPPASKPASRRSSIDPRKVFSAPLRLMRKFSKPSCKVEIKPNKVHTPSLNAKSKIQLPDHESYLRRRQTSEALRQVTSILEQTSPVRVINPLSTRTLSEKSTADSQDSRKHKHEKKMAKGLAVETHKSLQDLLELEHASQRSSQMELRKGLVPHSTPDEHATYKIKRSPSSESEEFLKIDITIRGGTSYLPSEARRIHTPPLPQDGLDGRKRGFFFDYNAPKRDEIGDTSFITTPASPNTDPKAPHESLRRDTSRASTIGRRALSFKRSTTTKARAGDWYDAKLAELEIDDDDDGDDSRTGADELKSVDSRGRSMMTKTSWSELVLASKKKEAEQLDHSIPEHLPTSPLCPRNKRYWRVVQGSGSQLRGCWMHGIGEYE